MLEMSEKPGHTHQQTYLVVLGVVFQQIGHETETTQTHDLTQSELVVGDLKYDT